MGVGLTSNELVGLLVATSFAAGLNVYATVATLGLLAHTGFLALPVPLHMLTNWWVIGASGALFLVEFFADKVPLFDLLWNALQTFVRGFDRLRCYFPTFTWKATARCFSRRRDCSGGPWRQDCGPGCSHCLPRTFFERSLESWRRRAGRAADHICHATSILSRGNRGRAGHRDCLAGS
jgi:hypothetical protein